MENTLYSALKNRMLEEMTESLQRHPLYSEQARAYHRYHMNKERPQLGVVLQNTSADRLHLCPDDFVGELKSMVTLATAGNAPGTSIEWVWEDAYNLTPYVRDEVASLNSSRTVLTTANTPISAGKQNPSIANNFAQVKVKVDGVPVLATRVNGSTGEITLPQSVDPSSEVTVSYYYLNVDRPGYYYLEMESKEEFSITPMYLVYNEVVIENTTGTEIDSQLENSPVLIDYVMTLYTKKKWNSTEIILERGVDYSVQADGTVTFLRPLPQNTTLYATYRYQGENRGPFRTENEYEFNSEAIKGVVLAFGSRKNKGDKQVIVLSNRREEMASVYGGHYVMNLEWRVFSKDPQTTSEMADHLVSDLWGLRKETLKYEGITIQEINASGESEEVYEDSVGEMYFQNTINMEIMTEWKRFVPHVIKLNRFNFQIRHYTENSNLGGSKVVVEDVELNSKNEPFTVQYPQTSFPVFY